MDLKGLGYLVSSISVVFLGIVAWPGPGDPSWQGWAVAIGMLLSVVGMAIRFRSHQMDRQDIKRAANNLPPKAD